MFNFFQLSFKLFFLLCVSTTCLVNKDYEYSVLSSFGIVIRRQINLAIVRQSKCLRFTNSSQDYF